MDIWDQFVEGAEKAGSAEFLRYEDIEGASVIGILDRIHTTKKGREWLILIKAQVKYPPDENGKCRVYNPPRPIALSKTVVWLEYDEDITIKDRPLRFGMGEGVGVFVGKERTNSKGNNVRDLTIFPMDIDTLNAQVNQPQDNVDAHQEVKEAHVENAVLRENQEAIEACQTEATDF